LLVIATKPGIIKIIQGFTGETFLNFVYVYDIGTNTCNAIGTKLTLFASEITILTIGRYIQVLIFYLDRINGTILPWFD
jgi:hypothetical protein